MFEYAGLGTRFIALLIDSLILALVLGIFLATTGYSFPDASEYGLGLVPLLTIGAVFLYFTMMEGILGATIGKMIFRVKVVKEDGSACGIGASLVRNLLRIVDGIFFYVVGAVLIVRSQKRQRLGDKVAKTVVIRPRRMPLAYGSVYPPPPPAYVPSTSSPTPPTAPPSMKYCMSCGSLIPMQAMFCPRCGGHQ